MTVIRTAKIPKINKIEAKICASVYYKTSESVFSKNIKIIAMRYIKYAELQI